jgi:hypothetical protein
MAPTFAPLTKGVGCANVALKNKELLNGCRYLDEGTRRAASDASEVWRNKGRDCGKDETEQIID